MTLFNQVPMLKRLCGKLDLARDLSPLNGTELKKKITTGTIECLPLKQIQC